MSNEVQNDLEVLKDHLVDIARRLHSAGFVLPGEGNISVRLPSGDFIITPTANRYTDLKSEDLVVAGPDGTVDPQRSGNRGPSSEIGIHAALLRQRPLAAAVVHVHPPETVAHAVMGREIPLIVEEMAILLGGPVPCAPYRRTGTEDLVQAVLGAIGSGNAVMLANHGLLTCGRSLEDAVDTALVVEKLAGIHRRACELAGGQEPPRIPDADFRILVRRFREGFATAG